MSDKIILVYYVGVGNLDPQDALEQIENVTKLTKIDDENIIQYFIPTREETRVECVYPKYILKDEADENEDFKSVIKKLDTHLKNITNEQ